MLAEKALADEDRARRRAERQRCQCWERLVRLWLLRDTTLRRRKHRIVLAAFTSWMAWSVLSREQRRRQEQGQRHEQGQRLEQGQWQGLALDLSGLGSGSSDTVAASAHAHIHVIAQLC